MKRLDYALAAGLVLLLLALRVPYLAAYPVAVDEPVDFYHAQFSVGHLLHHLSHDPNAPLYDILLHFWMRWSGLDVFRVRLFSLLCYAGSTALLYATGRRFFSREVGLVATLLFLLTNLHAHYAQEARGYALFLLLSLAATYQWLGLLERATARRPIAPLRWLGLAGTYVALLHTHYFGLFVLVVHGLSLPVTGLTRPLGRGLLGAGLLTALGLVPWAQFVVQHWRPPDIRLNWWLAAPRTADAVLEALLPFGNSVLGLGLLTLLAALGYFRRPALTAYERVCLLFFPGAVVGMLVLSFGVPMFLDRYLIFTAPALHLLTARALERMFPAALPRRLATVGVLAVLVVGYQPVFDRHWHMPELVRQVRARQRPGTQVYMYPQWDDLGFCFYYDRAAFRLGPDRERMRARLAQSNVYPIVQLTAVDSARLRRARHVLVLESVQPWPSHVVPVAQALFPNPPRRVLMGRLRMYEFSR
jgi:hypothetical protein